MKRLTACLLCICLLFSVISPVTVIAADPEDEIGEDDAPERERIEIKTAADLCMLAKNCHEDTYSTEKDVYLMEDISLAGSDFTSIPIFGGNFFGQGHVISGYTYGGDGYVTGFFRYLEETAIVRDLTIAGNIEAAGQQQISGGLVGVNEGSVENCRFTGHLSGRSECGGIAGINDPAGNILDCVNEGEIFGYYYTGGICGKNYGMVYGCKNIGNLNNSIEWVEEDDAMSGEFLTSFTQSDAPESRVRTGVDTGGIAGFSRGALINCSNEGTVGYEHTGYNIGGIVGRQSGSITGCINRGTVLGRKDIGGIAGQMEPYIELTDGETVSNEVHKLHDMVSDLLDMMDSENDQVHNDLVNLQTQAENVSDKGNEMAGQASDYVNANIEAVNDAGRRLSYVMEQMPSVTGNVDIAADDLKEMVSKIRKANEDLYIYGYLTDEEKSKADELLNELENYAEELEKLQKPSKHATAGFWVHSVITEVVEEEVSETVSDDTVSDDEAGERETRQTIIETPVPSYIKNGDSWEEITAMQDNWFMLTEGAEYKINGECIVSPVNTGASITLSGNSYSGVKVKKLTGDGKADKDGYYRVTTQNARDVARQAQLMAGIASDIAKLMVLYAPYMDEAVTASDSDIKEAMDALEAAGEAAGVAQSSLEAINAYLNAQSDLQMVKVEQQWNDNMDEIHKQLNAMSGTMADLGDHSMEYSTEVNDQLRKINDQINKIYNMIEQDLKDITGEDRGFIYADISDTDLNDITMGKVSGSSNYGNIRGDINIGGIAGSMAIDEDDPEENAAGTAKVNINGRYTTQNVISACINRGYITAKNDGAGGMTGFMKSGVISHCNGYGFVESREGNYVGGIAGQSLAVIRNAYVLCSLSGGSYVGGIAGSGTTITGCYAMPMVQRYDSRCGAIAGKIDIDEETGALKLDKLSDNHYVSDSLYGIDQISYRDSADRMSYEELLSADGVPAEFRNLTVTFRVGDRYLSTQKVKYGDDISVLTYPIVPEKEGYFASWQEVTGDKILGNLVISAEYIDRVKLLESGSSDESSGKKLALIDRSFDDKATLNVTEVTEPGFVRQGYRSNVIYQVKISDSDISADEEVSLRLYDPYDSDKIEVWTYKDNTWQKQEILIRGSYVQVNMKGSEGIYCIALPEQNTGLIIAAAVGTAAVVMILIIVITAVRKKKKSRH